MSFELGNNLKESASSTGKGKLSNLKALKRYLSPYSFHILLALTAIAISSTSVLGIGAALKHIIDNALHTSDINSLDTSFYMLMSIVITLGFASFLRVYTTSMVGEKVIAKLRNDIYNHIISLSPSYFDRSRSGDLMSRLSTDTTLLQAVITGSVAVALRNFVLLIGGLTMLIITSGKLTEYVLMLMPVVILPVIILGRRVRKLSRSVQDKVGDLSNHMQESLGNIRAIHAFNATEKQSMVFAGLIAQSLDAAMIKLKNRSILTGVVITFIFGAITAVLWVGSRYVIRGEISGGELSSFLFYSVIVASSVGSLSEIFGDLQRAAGAAERITELLNIREHIIELENPIKLPEKLVHQISFNNVNFAYSGTETNVLKNFSLQIPHGATVALVGASGAGKTTVFNLLLRFYDAQSGSILIDDTEIKSASLESLRSLIGIVPQDPYIFSASAFENIRLGKPDATMNEVVEAARKANADEFISRIPDGYYAALGERGIKLSGGQKQRIAIARAILRNPSVLLLDEATSALDSENEKLIQESLAELTRNRTTIVIAHRLSTIIKADKIAVINNGMVEAEGKHEELLQSSELYAKLAKLQFS